mgnify:CR=1 FL=1
MRYKFYFFVYNYNIEMQSILDRLKVKPKAKKIDLITVKVNPEKKEDVAVNVSIIDKRKEITINRQEILKTIQQRSNVTEPTKKEESKTSQELTEKTKKKSKKIGKISLKDDSIQGKSSTKRITEKPETNVVFEGTPKEVVIGTYIDKERLPKKTEKIILSSSSYYMNNRQKFTSFINNHFKPYKEQFKLLKSTQSCSNQSKGEFTLLLHQKLVRDYLNLYTPYRGLLLYHGLGSGKTCTSIAIAEGMKTSQNVIVMTPKSLRRNYIEELKFCGDSMFKKNQYWEFVNGENEEIIQELGAILSINIDYIRKNNGAWLVNMKKESNYDNLSAEDQHNLDLQINEMIRTKYQFIHYNGLRESHLELYTHNYTINPFDNRVVIIDEAHNFVSRISNKLKRPESIAMRLYNYLMNAENCRIVLLTGTPIINYPNELGILFNILRGYIKSWSLKLNIKTREKINQESIKNILYKSKALASILDFIEYKSSSKTLVLAKNPMGFVNRKYRDEYKGVFKNDERGNISDTDFLKFVSKILRDNDIDVIDDTEVTTNKALPDDKDEFINYFVDENNKIKNENLFQKRIIGLTSHYGDIEELMPSFNKKVDMKHIYLEMSDYQFAVYESARIQERKQERNNKKKAKKGSNDIYENTSSTYRIFSRAFCNFVFPKTISRPFPKESDTIESAVTVAESKNEDLLDGNSIETRLSNIDGEYTNDDVEQIKKNLSEISDSSYDSRIKKALEQLKNDSSSLFEKESLKTFSPKFLNMLENIQDESHRGLHLVYSQFRTLEGIGIFKLILEHYNFVQFKLKKNGNGETKLDISDEDRGKPMFGLYTGTETDDEKELIRKVYNSDWDNIPTSLREDLETISNNNFYGEIMKVILITASGAEGISLKNCRYVHITEPYWHPVRIDQVIGRARRICSHENLEPDLRNVTVFLYIMKLSEDLIKSDKTLELRLHDKSKLDNSTPVTTDEALDEIAIIKEEISKNLLKAVKQSAIDCSVYQQKEGSDPLVCYSFGNVDEKKYSYYPSLEDEPQDKVAAQNIERVKWIAKDLKIKGKEYALHPDTKEVYDLDEYKLAVETGSRLNALGRLEEQKTGKIKFVKY